MKKKFICNDESLNTYGFVVKTDGIELGAFLKNPVMLWNHTRGQSGTESDILPIGRWENVRKEAGQLTAEAVFDENDAFAAKVAEKVKNGFVSACSIGIRILETDDEPKNWKPGQSRPTVTRCELREISVCDIPANPNAVTVALYDEQGKTVSLSDVPELLPVKGQNLAIAQLLGLEADASPEQVVEAVKRLKTDSQEARKSSISRIVTGAIHQRKITALQREQYEKIGQALGADFLMNLLDSMDVPMKPSEILFGRNPERNGGEKSRALWTLEDYRRNDPEALEADPDLLRRLLDIENERKRD